MPAPHRRTLMPTMVRIVNQMRFQAMQAAIAQQQVKAQVEGKKAPTAFLMKGPRTAVPAHGR